LIPTSLEKIAREVGGELHGDAGTVVDRICTDSRGAARGAIFVALKGEQTDGHKWVADAFRNGASAALVAKKNLESVAIRPDWPLIVTSDTLLALQALAGWHRRKYLGKVVAITGSNGKTIVKDALRTLLAGRELLASPGSYNSQLGMPLAILSAEKPEPLGILEVGISAPGEMEPLEKIAAPDFGILTNIGMAHFSNFGSREAIAREKMLLFRNIGKDGWLLAPAAEAVSAEPLRKLTCPVYEIGNAPELPAIIPGAFTEDGQVLDIRVASDEVRTVNVRTRSAEIIADLHIASCAAYLLGASVDEIALGLEGYTPPPTRVELWSSPQGIRLINDGYSADPISVQAALRAAALSSGRSGRKIFAFAGMRELGATSEREHRQVGSQAGSLGFSHLFLVGNGELQSTAEGFSAAAQNGQVARVQNPEQLKEQLLPLLRPSDTVLFKGPRNSGIVKAVRDLSGAIAQRCQWINLAAIESNISRFRRHCAGAHVMAMLKAMAYGTDLAQLAGWMSRLGVRHIGVSSANEGVSARKAGAGQDIFVFLSEPEDLDNLLRYRLTPVIYSAALVESFGKALAGSGQSLDVHLKVDTGMHRLGVAPEDALALAEKIRSSGSMRIAGVCTHFAAADDPKSDEFTRQQIAVFNETIAALRRNGFSDFIVHAANTAAAVRFPEARYDMVRIGLGLYGIYPSDPVRTELELELAIGVTSRVTSIQEFAPGATLGYNRTFTAARKTRVGVVPFGYDDGLPWGLSGKGQVLVEGRPAPILGRISMDQMQVDVTDLPGIGTGAEVLLYGTHNGHTLRPELVAQQAGTISHELLTRLGERVHRIYVEP
jgi:alanine racemase